MLWLTIKPDSGFDPKFNIQGQLGRFVQMNQSQTLNYEQTFPCKVNQAIKFMCPYIGNHILRKY